MSATITQLIIVSMIIMSPLSRCLWILRWRKLFYHRLFSSKLFWNISNPLTEFTALIGLNSFICKSMSTHLKVQVEKPDNYRKLVHFLMNNDAKFHTYQLQNEKIFGRIVRNLHPSTPASDISLAIGEIGFSTMKVTKIEKHRTKIPLSVFSVDLEAYSNNKDIFNVSSLESKSIYCTFSLRTGTCPPLYINNKSLPSIQQVRCLCTLIDRRLTWLSYVSNKTRLRLLFFTLPSSHTKLSVELLLYKQHIRRIWTYSIRLWGAAKISNTNCIQRFQ